MSTRISTGVDDCPFYLYISMIPIDCKITNFSLYLCNKMCKEKLLTLQATGIIVIKVRK